jgi:hypothetical protein
MSNNPFQSPVTPANKQDQTQSVSEARAAYNVVSDTVTGVNVRWSDNRFQLIFVFVSVALASSVGAILAALNPRWNLPWYGGAMIGSFAGLVIGIFASGIFLLFYRAARHLKGKHD